MKVELFEIDKLVSKLDEYFKNGGNEMSKEKIVLPKYVAEFWEKEKDRNVLFLSINKYFSMEAHERS